MFQGHEDLLAEFVSFLPNNSGSGSGSGSAQHPLSARNAQPAMHPMHFDKVSSCSFSYEWFSLESINIPFPNCAKSDKSNAR